MEIKYAILGFLSWKPSTGYDLKKLMTSSEAFYWSGNNNQIYTALVALHREGLVEGRLEEQDRYPSRRVYSITRQGSKALREWVASNPELPQYRSLFLAQLAWADALSEDELDGLIGRYEQDIDTQLKMANEKKRRGGGTNPARTPREKYIWQMIDENHTGRLEQELAWTKELRKGVNKYSGAHR
jgi:DNA-binding PadR family transcriptional regulator